MTNERDWYEEQMAMLNEQLTSARKIEDQELLSLASSRYIKLNPSFEVGKK